MIDRKVLVLVCGGAITMKPQLDGSFVLEKSDGNVLSLEKKFEDLNYISKIDVRMMSQGFSHNVGVEKWDSIINVIKEEYDNYYGFVITTGADTIAYLSAGLSFAMKNIGKPVVITGARHSIYEIKTDAKTNLINSVCLAISNVSGVFVVFGSKIISGVRATRSSRISLDCFSSFNKRDFAVTNNIFSSVSTSAENRGCLRHGGKPNFDDGFDSNVLCISLIPDMDIEFLKYIPKDKLKAIVFQVYGTGILPNNFIEVLEYLKDNRIPVIVATACREGTTSLDLYAVSEQKGLELNIIEAYDMSPECACVKVMWMLDNNISYERFKEEFQKNVLGEIDKSVCNAIMEEEHYFAKD